jgi:hypothetical protein
MHSDTLGHQSGLMMYLSFWMSTVENSRSCSRKISHEVAPTNDGGSSFGIRSRQRRGPPVGNEQNRFQSYIVSAPVIWRGHLCSAFKHNAEVGSAATFV